MPSFKIVLMLLCLLLPTAKASGGDSPIQGKLLRVAFYEGGYLYSDGQGIDRDFVDELQRRGGYRFAYVEQPRARTWKELKDGTLPMTVSAIRSPEREAFAYFIPYHAQKNMVLTLDPELRSPSDLIASPNSKIAVVRGFRHGETYDQLIKELERSNRVIEVATTHNLFLMLRAGNRMAAIFALPVFYRKELPELGLQDRVRIMDWAPQETPIAHNLALSKAHFSEQDYRDMAAIVQGMRKDGTLRRLLGRYLTGAELESALDF